MRSCLTVFWYGVFVSRITGKEEMVNLYQEEAEVFKEKNYNHKERVSCACKIRRLIHRLRHPKAIIHGIYLNLKIFFIVRESYQLHTHICSVRQ